jgi:hypothetical protein
LLQAFDPPHHLVFDGLKLEIGEGDDHLRAQKSDTGRSLTLTHSHLRLIALNHLQALRRVFSLG